MSVEKPKLLIITGPSGAGKDEVVKRIEQKAKGSIRRVVTYTSRPKGEGEVEGIDYHFVSKAEFESMIAADEFEEWFVYGAKPEQGIEGDYEGTTKASLRVDEGYKRIWRVDPKRAAHEAEKRDPSTAVVYIGVENLTVLKNRAKRRGRDYNHAKFTARLKEDWSVWKEKEQIFRTCATVIINKEGELEETVAQVMALIS